jgi:TRAP-type mannitol/chloroaromatic compound transport system permease small subunit
MVTVNDANDGAMLATANRFYSIFEDVLAWISAIGIFLLMFFGTAQIVMAKLFNYPIFGYIDLVEQSIALFAFLAVAYCQRLGGHVRMELIISRFSGRTFWFAEVLSILASMVFVALMTSPSYGHFLRAWEAGDSSINAEIAIWPTKLMVPVALSILWLRLLLQFFGYFRLFLNPNAAPIAVPLVLAVEEQAEGEIQDALGDDFKAGENEGSKK